MLELTPELAGLYETAVRRIPGIAGMDFDRAERRVVGGVTFLCLRLSDAERRKRRLAGGETWLNFTPEGASPALMEQLTREQGLGAFTTVDEGHPPRRRAAAGRGRG